MAKPQAKSTIWEFLQSLGKTFMLPVALLAALFPKSMSLEWN